MLCGVRNQGTGWARTYSPPTSNDLDEPELQPPQRATEPRTSTASTVTQTTIPTQPCFSRNTYTPFYLDWIEFDSIR